MSIDSKFEGLLGKYDRPVPRYTSYPTAREFHPEVGVGDYIDHLGRLRLEDRLSIYVHIPFCERRCSYCGCYVIPTMRRTIAAKYLDHLYREISLVRGALGRNAAAAAIHLGGGTPTYLSPTQIEGLLGTLRRSFEMETGAEVSIELDPRVTTAAHLEALQRGGANRLSIGVQDTSCEVQQAIGRFQDREQSSEFFKLCRSAGFDRINIDLVYGLPRQTLERFEHTLDDVIGFGPERFACFGYAHVPWMRPHQKAIEEESLPGARDRIQLLILAHRKMAAAGYRHIGMDHFALPGDELSQAQDHGSLGRNFMGYTPRKNLKVLGLGISSIGDLGSGYFQNEKKLSRYFDRLNAGELPIERGFLLGEDDRLRRSAIQDILCNLRLDFDEFQKRSGVTFANYFAAEMKELREIEADELVEITPAALAVKPLGRLLLRNIAAPFDAYLRRIPTPGKTFSRAV